VTILVFLSRPSLLDEIYDEVPWATAEDLRRVAQTSFSRRSGRFFGEWKHGLDISRRFHRNTCWAYYNILIIMIVIMISIVIIFLLLLWFHSLLRLSELVGWVGWPRSRFPKRRHGKRFQTREIQSAESGKARCCSGWAATNIADIAMENPPFVDDLPDLPIKHRDFPCISCAGFPEGIYRVFLR